MELVISIVSWNTKVMLRECLVSLRKNINFENTRIIVIDNASSDGTPEMLRTKFPEVTLIESGGNLGFGKGHNLIALHSSEPYVLFLNPDTLFVENTHEKMIEIMKKYGAIGAVGCRMVNLDGTVQQLGIQWRNSPIREFITGLLLSKSTMRLLHIFLPYQDPFKSGFVKKLYGGCLLVRRDILDKIGWFDERFFMYAEDVDLSRRIIEDGFQLYYLSSSMIIHTEAGASSKTSGQFSTLMQCESIEKLMEKYYGALGRYFYLFGIFIRSFLRITMVEMYRRFMLLAGKKINMKIIKSQKKNLSLMKWCLGLVQPRIPK